MGFSSQAYWSRLPFPSPGYLPNPEIKPGSPAFQVDSLPSESPRKPNRQVGGLQNSVCQRQFPCGRTSSPEWLLPALSPRGVLVASWLSRRFSKVVWPRLISNYCLCAGLWAWRILHVPFKSEFLFPAALHPSCTQAPRAIRARCSGDSSAQCRTPGLGCWRGAQTPCSSARTSATVMILPLWVTHPGHGMGLDYIASPTPLVVVPSLYF